MLEITVIKISCIFIKAQHKPDKLTHSRRVNDSSLSGSYRANRIKMIDMKFMLIWLLIGLVALMAVVVISKDRKQSIRSAIYQSVLWGLGYSISVGVEIFAFANI